MYKEPHLQVKNAECNKLWYEWFELFNNPETRHSEETKRLRKKWCKCVDELSVMLHQAYLDMPNKPPM